MNEISSIYSFLKMIVQYLVRKYLVQTLNNKVDVQLGSSTIYYL